MSHTPIVITDDFNTTKITNPAIRYISWSASDNALAYYDKEKKEKVLLEGPQKFLPLKILYTIKGYHSQYEASIISNEIIDLKMQELAVSAYPDKKRVEVARGTWETIKEQIKNVGGKFTLSVYAIDEEYNLINLQINGCALAPFFDAKVRIEDKAHIVIAPAVDKFVKSKTISYYIPQFSREFLDYDEEISKTKNKELLDYLNYYFNIQPKTEVVEEVKKTVLDTVFEMEDELPQIQMPF